MKAYIVKYALSRGIIEAEGKANFIGDGDYLQVQKNDHELHHYHGKEWAETKQIAIALAEEMRLKRIASLERQIAKLRAMEFN